MTRKPVDSDNQDMTTATMTRNDKKYKWCTSCNNDKGAWGFHWKDGHEEWKNKQGKKPSGSFSIPAIISVKSPCTLTIISRYAPFVLLVVAGRGGCCQILCI